MEEEIVPTPQTPAKKPIAAYVLTASLVSALLAAGIAYAIQNKRNDKADADLQAQVNSLKSQINAATPTPLLAPAAATAAPTAIPTASPVALVPLPAAELVNFTFYDVNGTLRTLHNGTATFSLGAQGTGTLTLMQDFLPAGDLDGDGVLDNVAILRNNLGGTGTFPILEAILTKANGPVLTAETGILSDRAAVNSLTIDHSGVITVDGTVAGPNDPLSSPSQHKVEKYKLVGNKLVAQ